MPKRVFWPLTMVVMGLIFLASNLGMLPREFWNLWPLILIVVGLGGLLTSDREQWLVETQPKRPSSAKTKRPARKKK
jgi:hypothetical protein